MHTEYTCTCVAQLISIAYTFGCESELVAVRWLKLSKTGRWIHTFSSCLPLDPCQVSTFSGSLELYCILDYPIKITDDKDGDVQSVPVPHSSPIASAPASPFPVSENDPPQSKWCICSLLKRGAPGCWPRSVDWSELHWGKTQCHWQWSVRQVDVIVMHYS